MDKKSKFTIKCPRCRKIGRLRLKDKRYNSVIIVHYDAKKYQEKKKKWIIFHHIGTIKRPEKFIEQIFEKYEYVFNKIEKKEFVRIIRKFAHSIKTGNEENITQSEILGITSILNELRRIRKTQELEFKIDNIEREWDLHCKKCNNPIKIIVKVKGVKINQKFSLYSENVYS